MDAELVEKLEGIYASLNFKPNTSEQYFDTDKNAPIPDIILNPPGILADIAAHYNTTARKPQPLFAVATAISIASVVLGRHYRTTKNNYSSLYLLLIARSGTGKEHVINTCEEILQAAGLDYLIGPKGYTSEAGVLTALNKKPRHIAIIDEFGRRLEEIKTAGNSNAASAVTQMMEVFGRCHGVARPRGYAVNGLKLKEQTEPIIKPALTAVCLTTPAALFDNLSVRTIKDGMLNRFLVLISNQPRMVSADPDITPIPESIIKWCQDYGGAGGFNLDMGGGESATGSTEQPNVEPHLVRELEFAPECAELLAAYDALVIERANELEANGLDDMPGRLKENVMRLALICALANRAERVEMDALNWALAFVDYCYTRFLPRLQKDMTGSPYEADKLCVLKALRDLNTQHGVDYEGARLSWMKRHKPFSKFKTKDLSEILSDLVEAGLVDERPSKNTDGPRPVSYLAIRQRNK